MLADVRLPPDNSRSENSIRIVALGRRNFRVAQSADAGDNVALVYSPIASCERAGADPIAYLTDALGRVDGVSAADSRELPPDRWRPSPKTSTPADFDVESPATAAS